jgi:hypothetical protein
MNLPDVNVLVALAWESHPHHRAARRWFAAQKSFATCAVTQLGFLRVSTLAEMAGTLDDARRALVAILAFRQHTYWRDVEPLEVPILARGPQQLTDAYLASLAMHYRGRFTTFDAEVSKLPGVDANRLEILG